MTKAKAPERWKAGYTYCMVQSLEGPLMNWKVKDWKEACKWTYKADGTKYSDYRELKRAYLDLVAKGWRVIPTGSCDMHHKKHGCLGHKEENVAVPAEAK